MRGYMGQPGRFTPPTAEHVGPGIYTPPNSFFDGDFYQPLSPEEVMQRREAIQPFADAGDFSRLTLHDYQSWVELDWKQPHCTPEANKRLVAKLYEEGIDETLAELKHAPRHLTMPPNRTELIGEQGDTLWTSVALMSNASVHLERPIARLLHREELSARIKDTVSFIDVDYAIAAGYVPSMIRHAIAPEMVDDWEDELDPVPDLFYRVAQLGLAAIELYDLFTPEPARADRERQTIVFESVFQGVASRVENLGAENFMLLAYIAQRSAKSTLAEVALANYRKISERVTTGTVDKSDGARAE